MFNFSLRANLADCQIKFERVQILTVRLGVADRPRQILHAGRRIRVRGTETDPRTPVPAVTAHALRGDGEKRLKAGFDE